MHHTVERYGSNNENGEFVGWRQAVFSHGNDTMKQLVQCYSNHEYTKYTATASSQQNSINDTFYKPNVCHCDAGINSKITSLVGINSLQNGLEE